MNSRLNARVYCVATFSPHRNDTARFCVCYSVVMFVTIAVIEVLIKLPESGVD